MGRQVRCRGCTNWRRLRGPGSFAKFAAGRLTQVLVAKLNSPISLISLTPLLSPHSEAVERRGLQSPSIFSPAWGCRRARPGGLPASDGALDPLQHGATLLMPFQTVDMDDFPPALCQQGRTLRAAVGTIVSVTFVAK